MSEIFTNYVFQAQRNKASWSNLVPQWLSTNSILCYVQHKSVLLDTETIEAANLLIKDNATNFTSTPLSLSIRGVSNVVVNKHLRVVNKDVAIIVPCYNEEKRLKVDAFKDFLKENTENLICFVNDGSSDNTSGVLESFRQEFTAQVLVINCIKNLGKAGAVRAGVNYLKQKQNIKYLGFLDADLSTDFDDFKSIIEEIKNSNFKIVSGSRISRMGAQIVKPSSRGIISKSINLLICTILGMNFQDTQCGAKIMTKDMADLVFRKPFLTRWLFDVEIFMRMKILYGKEKVTEYICEHPLKKWVHVDDSKLSFRDSIKILFQLFQITYSYGKQA